MKQQKRVSSGSAVNGPVKRIGEAVIERCDHCPRYMVTLCQETGQKIKYPRSGPIPLDCPLEDGRVEEA